MTQSTWSNDIVPRKTVEWEDGHDGVAVLLIPRFRKGFLAKHVQPRLKKPFIKVTLDEFGTFVWKKMDGETNFGSIVTEMNAHFDSRLEQGEERLMKFLTILQRNGFAELLVPTSGISSK